MRKIVKVLLVTLIFLMLLVGCGGNEKPADTSTANDVAPGVPDEEVTLKVTFFEAGFGKEWQNWLKAEFEKEHTNVTVELVGDANLLETITPMIESGVDAPDVFMTNGSMWEEWGPQGLVMDLTSLYDEVVPGTDMTLDKYITDVAKDKFYFDLGEDNGGVKKYAVPWSAGPMSVVYNANMFEEHGWVYPETWKEFEILCEEIKAAGIAPLTYPGKYPNYTRPFIRSWQLQAMGEESFLGEFKNPTSADIYGDPAILESFTNFKKLFDNGWIMEGTTALDHTQVQMEFINNKVAMILNGYWLEQEMSEVWPEGYKIVMSPVPQAGKIDKPTTYLSMPDYVAVYNKTEVLEVAKEFLLFSLSPESCEQFAKLAGGLRPFNYELSDVSDFTKSCQDIIASTDYHQFTDASSNPLMFKSLGNDYLNKIATNEITPDKAAEEFKKEAASEYDKVKTDLGL